jgi:hypothetical protein
MAWYHSGIGFFVNSTLTMASVYLGVWLIFVFALAGALTVRSGNSVSDVTDAQLISTVNTVQIFQLGLLSVIPYWGELCLESGFLNVCTFSCTPSRAHLLVHKPTALLRGVVHSGPLVTHLSLAPKFPVILPLGIDANVFNGPYSAMHIMDCTFNGLQQNKKKHGMRTWCQGRGLWGRVLNIMD